MLLGDEESVKIPEPGLDEAGRLNSYSKIMAIDSPIRWHFLKAHLEKYLSELMPYFVYCIPAQPLFDKQSAPEDAYMGVMLHKKSKLPWL